MSKTSLAVLLFIGLSLTSCGKQDVHSACYSNGDHANMSDGKITRICDCIDAAVKRANLTEQETQWVITLLNKEAIKELKPGDAAKAKKIEDDLIQLKTSCVGRK